MARVTTISGWVECSHEAQLRAARAAVADSFGFSESHGIPQADAYHYLKYWTFVANHGISAGHAFFGHVLVGGADTYVRAQIERVAAAVYQAGQPYAYEDREALQGAFRYGDSGGHDWLWELRGGVVRERRWPAG